MRTAKDPDFIYFRDKMAYEQSQEFEALSLNIATRKKINEEAEMESLRLINARRKAKGETIFASFDEMEEALTEEAEKNSQQGKDNEIDREDAFLQESAHILLDGDKLLKTL